MNEERIEDLQGLCKRATLGPWSQCMVWAKGIDGVAEGILRTLDTETTIPGSRAPSGVIAACGPVGDLQSIHDGLFIAATRSALPQALNEIIRLRNALQFYSNPAVYEPNTIASSIDIDRGQIASQALAEDVKEQDGKTSPPQGASYAEDIRL